MSNKVTLTIIVTMICGTFAGLGIWLSARSETPRSPVPSEEVRKPTDIDPVAPPTKQQPKANPGPSIPSYRVISDRIEYDTLLRAQVEIVVFLEEHVTEEKLRTLLQHLYREAKSRGPFQYREHPNFVFIYVHAREGQDWVAMGSETAGTEFAIDIRDKLLATVNDPPVVKFGLTEDRRQMIWRDIVRIEDRASREAKEMYAYPMPKSDPRYTETAAQMQLQKQADYETALRTKYSLELAESVGLTLEQVDEIGDEGVTNWWEMPDPS